MAKHQLIHFTKELKRYNIIYSLIYFIEFGLVFSHLNFIFSRCTENVVDFQIYFYVFLCIFLLLCYTSFE